jgi:hypothetical protein
MYYQPRKDFNLLYRSFKRFLGVKMPLLRKNNIGRADKDVLKFADIPSTRNLN